MKRKINREKKLHRNIYHFPITRDQWFELVIFILGFSIFSDMLKKYLGDILALGIIIFAFFILLGIQTYMDKTTIIMPYRPKQQFIGLYCIEGNQKIELNMDNGLIPRDEEIKCLQHLIEVCFNDRNHKRGICLIGRSGSGKSTIINQFEYDKNSPYIIKNFSENYSYFEEYMLQEFKNNPEQTLMNSTATVIILDHFERYFFLSDEKKNEVKNTIKRIAKLPSVFIFSMREEYFIPFVSEFDINDLDGTKSYMTGNTGIFFFKEYLTGNRQNTDENILICGNKNENNDYHNVTKTMERLCEQAFGEEQRGKEIFQHFKNSTLIQQQIIFNMLKHEFDTYGEVQILDSNIDENVMMNQYFDIQLCSTGNYYMASRIMYLLCIGRNSGIFFTDDDVKNALCIFEQQDIIDFKECLNKLRSLNFIKYSKRNSTIYYEIAHDYIAKSYEAYANTELPVNVKNALDEFKSEYTRHTTMNHDISLYRKQKKWKNTGAFGLTVFIISICIAVISFGYAIQTGNNTLPWTIFTLCIMSLLYVFNFYMNITRHYRKSLWIFVTFFYLIAMILGTIATVLPEFWLHFLGAGNAFMGLSCFIIGMNFHLAESGRKWFFSYGLKTFAVGILLIMLALLVQFGSFVTVWIIDTKSLIQFLPMAALLIYSYLSHMNKEFFYVGVEGIFSTGR